MQNGTYVTGTIREHRKHFPVEIKALRLEMGDAAFYQHDDMVAAKYRAINADQVESQRRSMFSEQHMTPAFGHTNKR